MKWFNRVPTLPKAGAIISDGCRDYIAEVHYNGRTEVLTDKQGKPARFPSLPAAKNALRRAKVGTITLSIRVAADEACAGRSLHDAGFASLALPLQTTNQQPGVMS